MRRIIIGLLCLSFFCCTQQHNYKILNEEKIGKQKYSIDIEVPNEIDESTIREIFDNIKKENSGYNLYFVSFYLPGMTIGSGTWANANYNNGLKINTYGMTAPETEQLQSRVFEDSIGVWKDNLMGTLIHLIKNDENYIIRFEFNDGTHFDKSVKHDIDKLSFEVLDSPSGDYYIVIGSYLEAWDSEGKIARYDIIKEPDIIQIK